MNRREIETDQKYVKAGWNVLDKGAPDRAYFKTNEKGEVIDVLFAEIKSPTDEQTIEQFGWMKVLDFLKAKFKLEVIK